MTAMRSELAARSLLPVGTPEQVRGELRVLFGGRRRALAAALLAMVADSVLALAGPIAIGWITQAIADHRSTSALIDPVALLAMVAVVGTGTGWASTVLLARAVLPAAADLREQALTAAVHLPIDAVEAGGIGDLVSRVSGDVEQIDEAAESVLGSFVGAGLTIVVTLVGLAGLDWRFALAGLLAVPIQAGTLRWYLRSSRPIYAAGRMADGARASALLAGFTALPTLRALGLGAWQRDRIADASADSMDCELRATAVATRFYGRLNLAEFVGLGAILLVAFVLVREHAASIGAATTAALFFASLFNPINTVLGSFDGIQQATAGLARLVGIVRCAPSSLESLSVASAGQWPEGAQQSDPKSVARSSDSSIFGNRRSGLRALSVSFGYPGGPDVLHGVSVDVAPGEQVAVVGTTGSGKSTFASLLSGLRLPRVGTIDIGHLTEAGERHTEGRKMLRDNVVLITQDAHVFAGTIADNLRLGAATATDDQLRAVLRDVQADWVADLPDGLQTVVGSGGATLSPSQAQHLALARALLTGRPVVILDEATAEGDSDAARTLDRAAEVVLRGRAGVVIAHRLSQAAQADRIVVMEAGQIVETGTHHELRARGGAYARLWSAWSSGASS